MIQALVIFFVGAELLIVYIWRCGAISGCGGRPAEEPAPS